MQQLATVSAGPYLITASGEPGLFAMGLEAAAAGEGVYNVRFSMHADTPARPGPVSISWTHPMVRTHACWTPGCRWNRTILPEWNSRRVLRSKNTFNAPVYALYAADGTNALTFALSDAMNPVTLAAGVREETARAECEARLFEDSTAPVGSYEAIVRLDTRPVLYWKALRDVADWWAALPGMEPMAVPEHARLPMYSAWYSFHQRVEPEGLERQCRLAKPLGMESIIIDDGWQTDDNSRGYAYCGDWEVAEAKLPDFAGHVRRVHAIGMKYIVWFSVPFVGVHSKAYRRFRDKVLDPASTTGWFVLDPRFPDVREYLVSLYESFVKRYDVDGLKLDFVDTFGVTAETRDAVGGGRDFESVELAVDALLTETTKRLKSAKSDVLIEFRQSYTGPLMRKYGNMFRAGDVPNDFDGNRIHTTDVRLIAGSTPAHSDMVMWNGDDPVESAAMQLAHTLFSVPQVSMLLDRLPADHVAMLRNYLAFWREHRDVLLDGSFEPRGASFLYPLVVARNDAKLMAACCGTPHAAIDGDVPQTLVLVNGTFAGRLVLDLPRPIGRRRVVVTSCTGEVLCDADRAFGAGPHGIECPPAGRAILRG